MDIDRINKTDDEYSSVWKYTINGHNVINTIAGKDHCSSKRIWWMESFVFYKKVIFKLDPSTNSMKPIMRFYLALASCVLLLQTFVNFLFKYAYTFKSL